MNLLNAAVNQHCLWRVRRHVALLRALVVVGRAVTVCQKALANTGELLSFLGIRMVHAMKIVDEMLLLLLRLFRKKLIKIWHNAVPSYSCPYIVPNMSTLRTPSFPTI